MEPPLRHASERSAGVAIASGILLISDSQHRESVEEMVGTAGRQAQPGDSRKLEREHLALIVDWLDVPDTFLIH